MQITRHAVVSIDYTLKDDGGNILDTSDGGEPLAYIQGIGNLIAGLETALEGRASGDVFNVSIPPEQAYGLHEEALILTRPRSTFNNSAQLVVGTRFMAETDDGRRLFTVTGIAGDQVTVNGNHPLAGKTLHFDVTVRAVRAATEEELNHGHAHTGHGGH